MTFPERIAHFLGASPVIAETAFVAPGAVVVGDVTLEAQSSVWFNATVRGDVNVIRIGAGSNIQDGAVVHVADAYPTLIGQRVTVGHNAIIHACTIGDEVLIGMGAIIMDGAQIGSRSIIGAGALVTRNTVVPPGSLVLGAPAKIARTLSEPEQQDIPSWAERYITLARSYQHENSTKN